MANWVPARVSAPLAALGAPWVGGSPSEAAAVVRRDAGAHPSPNAGVVEAAFAGALGVQLGGRNTYAGEVSDRGTLGDGRPPEGGDIARSTRLATHGRRRRAGRRRRRPARPGLTGGHGPRGRHCRSRAAPGGTAEARALAAALVEAGRPVISSLAGRVRTRRCPSARSGSAVSAPPTPDGVEGLAAYLTDHHIGAVVDATHPFAATISANAVEATARTGTPLLRLQRPGWRDHPDADRWTWVDSVDQAVSAGAGSRRPFLTTGRQSLDRFLPWADRHVTVRVVDPPEFALPERWRLIRSRGPYAYADELTLMRDAGSDLLVTKDSGGTHTAAKLDAARDLGVRVVVIGRPASPPDVPQAATVAEVLAWLG